MSLISNDQITKASLSVLFNSPTVLDLIDKTFSKDIANGTGSGKLGGVIYKRMANEIPSYSSSDADMTNIATPQVSENAIPVTLNKVETAKMDFTWADRRLVIEDFTSRYIVPAISSISSKIESNVIRTMTANSCGLCINKSADGKSALDIDLSFMSQSVAGLRTSLVNTNANLNGIFSPFGVASLTSSMYGMYNPSQDISRTIKTGLVTMPVVGISKVLPSALMPIHTFGTYTDTPTTGSAATATGVYQSQYSFNPAATSSDKVQGNTQGLYSAVTITGMSGTLNAGDVITIDGVNSVNRVTKEDTGRLMQFTVMSDVTSTSTEIIVTPQIIPPSSSITAGMTTPYQTVTAAPASGATIRPVGIPGLTVQYNLVFDKEAFSFVNTNIVDNVSGIGYKSSQINHKNLSLTLTEFGNGLNLVNSHRLDALYGIGVLRNYWSTIVASPVK